MKTFLLPKNFLAIILLIFLLLSSFAFSPVDVLTSFVVVAGTAIVADFVLSRAIFLPSAALVSGLIITLLVSPQNPLYITAFAAFIAILGKHLGRKFFNTNVFNPAAAGLFVTSIIFSNTVSWWGVSWGYIPLILTVVLVGYLVLFRMRRYLIPLSFLATYFLILKLLTFTLQLSTFFDPTLIFFALVMLPEPMTSPNDHKRQIFYGIFVAILVFVVGNFVGQLPFDPLITALLLGNLVFKFI